MPSQQDRVSQIIAQAAKDTRTQPWKAAVSKTAEHEETSSDVEANSDDETNPAEEVVKTGGPLDILTNFFSS